MCLKRCPTCAGWINPEDVCVECGGPFPNYPLEDDEPVFVERISHSNARLFKPVPEPPKPRPMNRQIIVGPDFGALLSTQEEKP